MVKQVVTYFLIFCVRKYALYQWYSIPQEAEWSRFAKVFLVLNLKVMFTHDDVTKIIFLKHFFYLLINKKQAMHPRKSKLTFIFLMTHPNVQWEHKLASDSTDPIIPIISTSLSAGRHTANNIKLLLLIINIGDIFDTSISNTSYIRGHS